MTYHTTLLACVALAFTSTARAGESIVERLQKTGVHIEFALVDDNGEVTVPNAIVIPNGWKWTDQADVLLREWISMLDTPLIIYINGTRVPGLDKVDSLQDDFPSLMVKWPLRAALGIKGDAKSDSCRVYSVMAGSPAESAGLKKGDTIVAVNGKAIDNFKMLRSAIREFTPGESVEIHVKREFRDMKINVTLAHHSLLRVRGEPSDAPESSKSPSPIDADPLGPGDR